MVAWLAGSARADVVMPPPASCPPGSLPTSSHRGPQCYPTACQTSQQCEHLSRTTIFECASAGLCLSSLGRRDHADSACTGDADCSAGTRCEVQSRCIAVGQREAPPEPPPIAQPPRPAPVATPARGCTAGGASAMVVLALIGCAGGLLVRRGVARRTEDARALLVARGRATHDELAALAPDVSAALAPLAERVRVEVDEGETVYVLDREDAPRERRET